MNRIKQTIVPLLVLLLIVVVLIYRLSSCASSSSLGGIVPSPEATAPSAGASATPPSAPPSPARFTNDDVTTFYKDAGFDVKEIRDAGEAALVQYHAPAQTTDGEAFYNFAWFDRSSGTQDTVAGTLPVDKFESTPDRTLTVLTTGKNLANGKQWFPEVVTSFYTGDNSVGTLKYSSETAPYFMPVTKSFTVGDDRHESVSGVVFDYNAVSVGFVPQKGHESEFDIAYRYIPKTSVVTSSGLCYVTFYNTTLAPGFIAPKAGAGDGMRSFVSMKSDGTNTVMTLKLGEKAERYNISMDYSPADGMPFAVLKFQSNGAVSYPAGW